MRALNHQAGASTRLISRVVTYLTILGFLPQRRHRHDVSPAWCFAGVSERDFLNSTSKSSKLECAKVKRSVPIKDT